MDKHFEKKTDTKPSVAIIIINWNNYTDSKLCLNSLKKCVYNNFKVVVVDNNSEDGSGQKLREEFEDFAIFLFNEKNLGFSGGNNVGIKFALENGFEYVMELNNDTEVEHDFLNKLIDSIDGRQEYGAAQPLIYYNGIKQNIIWNAGGTLINPLGISLTRKEGRTNNGSLKGEETDWITGCAFLIKSDVLKKAGLLKEFFFFGSFEDVDLSLRIKEQGYKLWFESSSVIYHSVGNSSKSKEKGKEGYLNPQIHYLVQRNQIIFIKQHTKLFFIPLALAFQFVKIIGFSAYFLIRRRPLKLKLAWKGFLDGLFKQYHD